MCGDGMCGDCVDEMEKELMDVLGYMPTYYSPSSPDGEIVEDFGEIVILRKPCGAVYEYIVYYDDGFGGESWENIRSYEDALRVAYWVWKNTGVGNVDAIERKLHEHIKNVEKGGSP